MEQARRQYIGLGTTLHCFGDGDVITVNDSGLSTYRNGQWCWWSWPSPPEDVRLQAVDLAHRQQWDELAVLVKLAQAM